MAVDWNIPFRAEEIRLRQLQVEGEQATRSIQNRKAYDRLIELGAQRDARPGIQRQVAAGDYRGAQSAAVGVGDYDLAGQIGRLDEAQRRQLASENEMFGRAAYALTKIPHASRQAAWQAMQPRFKALGFSDQELAGYTDFGDEALSGYLAMSQNVRESLASDLTQARIDDIGLDNERADMLADNTIANTQDLAQDRRERRQITARNQERTDARLRYAIDVTSRDRRRGQDIQHNDRIRAQDRRPAPRSGRSTPAPNNPPSMIPGATPELPVTVTTPAQAKMLPPGTYFRNPQGKVMRR